MPTRATPHQGHEDPHTSFLPAGAKSLPPALRPTRHRADAPLSPRVPGGWCCVGLCALNRTQTHMVLRRSGCSTECASSPQCLSPTPRRAFRKTTPRRSSGPDRTAGCWCRRVKKNAAPSAALCAAARRTAALRRWRVELATQARQNACWWCSCCRFSSWPGQQPNTANPPRRGAKNTHTHAHFMEQTRRAITCSAVA